MRRSCAAEAPREGLKPVGGAGGRHLSLSGQTEAHLEGLEPGGLASPHEGLEPAGRDSGGLQLLPTNQTSHPNCLCNGNGIGLFVRIVCPDYLSNQPRPQCGDADYPMDKEALRAVQSQVGALSHKWECRCGNDFVPPAQAFVSPPHADCEQQVGRGQCVGEMPAGVYNAVQEKLKRINRWSQMFRVKRTNFDGVWEANPLFFLGSPHGAAASSGAPPQGVVALLIFGQLNAQVFFMQDADRPVLGSILQLAPSTARLAPRLALVRRWLSEPSWSAYHIEARLVGFCAYQINALEELTALEAVHALKLAEARRNSALATAVRESAPRPRHRKKTKGEAPAHDAAEKAPAGELSPLDLFDKLIEEGELGDEGEPEDSTGVHYKPKIRNPI